MGTPLRALVVAGTPEAALRIAEILQSGGYGPYVERVADANRLRAALSHGGWDIVVSECILTPRFTAYDVMMILQEHRVNVPVILLSEGGDGEVAAAAMKAGAHDHLMISEVHRLSVVVERELRERPTRSERREAAGAARRAEELAARLAKVLDASGDEIYFFEAHTFQFIQTNAGAQRSLGYTEEELSTLTPLDVKPEVTRKAFEAKLNRLRTLGENQVSFETVHRRKDGSTYPVEVRLQFLASETPPLFVEIARDITERKRADQAVRESEERFRSLSESSPVGVFLTNLQGEIVYTNPRCQAICGFTFEESLGAGWADFVHPDDRERVIREWGGRATRGEPYTGEFRFCHPDGTVRRTTIHTAPVTSDDGSVFGHVGTVVDVTDRREAEGRIRFQARLLDAVGQAVIAADLEGRVIYWNRAAEQIYGWEPAEVLGRDVVELTATEASRKEGEEIMTALLAGASWTGEFPVRRKDGSTFTALVTNTPFVDDDGELKGIIGTSIDISDRKAQEQRLRESDERFRLLSRATNDCVWDWDLVNNEGWWSENFAAMFGYTDVGVGTGPDSWYARVHPDDRDRVVGSLQDVLDSGGNSWMEEYRFRRADGSWADILDRGYVIQDDDGRSIRMIGSMMDVSERKRAERELEASRRQVIVSEKLSALGTLVSGVAHEVRTPLTYIANNAFLLENRLKEASLKEPRLAPAAEQWLRYLRAIQEGTDRIKHLVRNLRQTARFGPGRRAPALLDEVVAEAVDLFRATHRGRVDVDVDLQGTDPVFMEKEQIQQVILNLLVNAAEAMAKGGTIRVNTRTVHAGAAVEVVDEGPGVPAELRERMFEPFYTTKPEGTGLGLSIAKRIVEAHEGSLTFESATGKGTTFTVVLPPAPSPEPPA